MKTLIVIDENGEPVIKQEFTPELEDALERYLNKKQTEVQLGK